jgi:hypothetical protein
MHENVQHYKMNVSRDLHQINATLFFQLKDLISYNYIRISIDHAD